MSQGFGAQKMEAAVEALTSNGNQREPSMEEILASIRRIIEDNDAPAQLANAQSVSEQSSAGDTAGSEVGRARDQHATQKDAPSLDQTWSPTGDARRGPSAPAQEAVPGRPSGDVETFRAELRDAPEGPDLHNGAGRPAPEPRGDNAGEGAVPIDRNLVQRLAEVQAAQPAPEKMRDSADQAESQPHAEQPGRHVPEAPASDEDARHSIVSDYAGRKVAAAFGELNEAFEANRRRNLGHVAEEMLRPMLQDWLDDNLPTIVERLVREEIERIARGG